MTNRNDSDNRNVVSFRVNAATWDAFRKAAQADHRTASQELRRLIAERIADEDQAEQEAA